LSEQPHSTEHFTASRDLWWHGDYLDLVASRLGLKDCKAVVDVGAGVGHWTALIAARCAPGATLTAIDREKPWVAELDRRFGSRPGFRAVEGDAASLPLPAASADLVTAQTLLVCVPDASRVLRDMHRVLKPGGLLLLAEPNNLANRMQMTSVVAALSPADYGRLATFWFAFVKGKEKLGLGQELIAELLPKLIVDAGFVDLRAFNNDRAWPEFPPYDTEEQVLARGDTDESKRRPQEAAERELMERCVLAGGLDRATLAAGLELLRQIEQAELRAYESKDFSALISGCLHVFAARKPGAD
jgi:ubiquinone/menaquinone biosynthesis C-methylase UbiE